MSEYPTDSAMLSDSLFKHISILTMWSIFVYKSVFMALLETNTAWVVKFLKFMKRLWVRNEYVTNKQLIILFLETNNASRVVS